MSPQMTLSFFKSCLMYTNNMNELCLSQEIKVLKEDLATRLNSNETAELLKEKDEQIKGLLEEGKYEVLF